MIWLEESGLNKVLRNRYSGQFKGGLRHGLGTFYYANGSTYEGSWEANQKHGYALYSDENGEVEYCYFENDKIVRKIPVSETLLDSLVNQQGLKNKFQQFRSSKARGEASRQVEVSTSLQRPEQEEKEKEKEEISKPVEVEEVESEEEDPEEAQNVYRRLVDVKDLMTEESRRKIMKQVGGSKAAERGAA